MTIMRPPRSATLFTLTLLSAALAGCGGSDGDSPPSSPEPSKTSATASPSLGKILNTGIQASCLPTGDTLGSGNTGSTGSITLTLSGSCSGPVLVSLQPQDGSTYYDEALGTTVALPKSASLRALVPNFTAGTPLSIAVTPLTEIATRQALTAAGGTLSAITKQQAAQANTAVVTQLLGTGVTLDILSPPTLWDGATAKGSLGTGEADRYAFYLAGLAALGSGATPALAVTDALATDLSDGTLSGSSSAGFSYTGAGFSALLKEGLSEVADYANPDLRQSLQLEDPPSPVAISGMAPTSGAVGSQVKLTGSGFDSDPFHLEVKFSNNVAAEIVSSTATEIIVKVPAGAATGPVTVKHIVSKTSATSTGKFTVTGGGGSTSDWTVRNSPTGFLLDSVVYGNGKFVAVGYGPTLLTSSDGVSWNTRTAPDSNFYEATSVTYDGSQFVLVGDSSNYQTISPVIATSTDGLTWTRRNWTNTQSETRLNDVTASAGRLTAVGISGTIITSTDNGISWSGESLPSGAAVASLNGVAGNSNTRVAVGYDSSSRGVILLNSGAGWTVAVGALTTFVPRDVIWTGSQYVAVGATSRDFGANAVIMTSPDGSTWTSRDLSTSVAPAGYSLNDVAWSGSKLYAVGDDNNRSRIILSSTDGVTWKQEHQSTSSRGNGSLAGVAASASIVISVGGVQTVTQP